MIYFSSGLKLRFTRAATVVFTGLLCILPSFATFTLDPTFGSGGKVLVSFPDSSTSYSSDALRVFIQPSGRIVVGGIFTRASVPFSASGVAIVGLEPNGLVDPTFTQTLDWRSDASTNLVDAHVYPDGSILRISEVWNFTGGGSPTVRIVRTSASGVEDTVFTSNVSIAPCGVPLYCPQPLQVAARSDGKILALITTGQGFFLYRLKPDGTRDATFGSNGIVELVFNKFSPLIGHIEMITLGDGKILLVGRPDEASREFFVGRLTETGMWDKSFGRVGVSLVQFGSGLPGIVKRALLQPDGKILLTGYVGGTTNLDVWMARLRPNGRLDVTFGNNGVVIADLGAGAADVAESIALSPDGKIRLAGFLVFPGKFLVARFSSSGSLEEHTTIPFTPDQAAYAYDVALQPDGKLVVVGRAGTINGTVFAIARLTE